MPRIPAPRPWKSRYYVTEAGGKGIKILCRIEDGRERADSELRKWLEECRQEKERVRQTGLVETDSPYTLAELAAELLVHKQATKSKRTVEYYQFYLQRFVDWYGNMEARKLHQSHSDQFIARLRDLGISNTSINHYLQAANAVLNHAVNGDRITKNPWKKVPKLPERERKRIVTDQEFQQLLAACDKCFDMSNRFGVNKEENAQLLKDILRILRFTALRPGEIRKLRWDHLHLDDGFIIIPAAEQKTGNTAKEPEDRLIPVLEEGKAILLSRKEKYGHLPRVFSNLKGEEWSDEVFSRRFARLRKRAGLDTPDHNGEKLVWYSLRHTRLTEAGTRESWGFYTLMKFAGHTSPKMTKRYVHPDKEDLKRAAHEGQKRRLGLEKNEDTTF